MRKGPLTPAFSFGYCSATIRQILFQIWHMYAVALEKFSEYGIVTFQPIREVTLSDTKWESY